MYAQPGALEDVRVIYRQQPKVSGANHFGSRLVFARDGTLFVTQGDRFGYRDQAQNLSSGLGKLVRIHPDGSVPRDNPFAGREGYKPEIYTLGHRNPLGLTVHPTTGALWSTEFGPRGGDELNLVLPGRNYGWPVATHGVMGKGKTTAQDRLCLLAGTKVPLKTETLRRLYKGKDDYVARLERRLNELIAQGWFLEEYANDVRADARSTADHRRPGRARRRREHRRSHGVAPGGRAAVHREWRGRAR